MSERLTPWPPRPPEGRLDFDKENSSTEVLPSANISGYQNAGDRVSGRPFYLLPGARSCLLTIPEEYLLSTHSG